MDALDELSDDTTDTCYHPVDRREYDAELENWEHNHQVMAWVVRCGECGEQLAQGWDRV